MSDFGCRDELGERVEPGLGLASVDDVVSISIVGTCVSIEASEPLDRLRTVVVVDAVNAAVRAGAVVSVWSGESSGPSLLPPSSMSDDLVPIEVAAVGAGVAVVRSEASTWMIDISGNRFVRGDRQLDAHLVPAAAWTPFDGLWISGDSISACIAPGRYVTARRQLQPVSSPRAARTPTVNQLAS